MADEQIEQMPEDALEGWRFIGNSRKAHYFSGGKSLCGKWALWVNMGLESGNDDSPDNCLSCRREMERRVDRLGEMLATDRIIG